MTLTQGRFISYEYDRMVVLFSMHDDEKEIHCAISTSAMDELEGGTLGRAGHRETQFMRLRERIEACAQVPPKPSADTGRASNTNTTKKFLLSRKNGATEKIL